MRASGTELSGTSLHDGEASGRVLRVEPLSFWGGTDLQGTITDERHPHRGVSVTGRVLVMRSGRGSSSSSSVLAEQLRTGAGPAAVILAEVDPIIVTGAIVAAELYQRFLPIVQLTPERFDLLRDEELVSVHAAAGAARVRSLGS